MTEKSSKPGQELFKFFVSEDPAYYDGFGFRRKLRELFDSRVREKVDTILKIPKGSKHEHPDLDNVTDATFAKCQRSLDPHRIAQGRTVEIRCYTCWAFVLLVAHSVATDFVRKYGRPWDYEEIPDKLLIVNPTENDPRGDDKPDEEQLRSFLARYIPADNLEMFFLRYAYGLPPREIHEHFKHLSANYISVKINRAMSIARRVLTPEVVEQLKRGKHEQQD